MAITRNFKLFLNAGSQIPLLIHANQYDSGEQWRFTLYNQDGSVYEPESGAIVGIKSDGKGIINTGSVSGGKVIITETQQMTAAAGKAIFELLIDGGSHGTANFIVLVEPKPGDNADLSDSDLSLIQEAINSTTPANIASAVSTWMDDNLTPTTPVVDSSLTVSGAAADAKKVGDEIGDLKSQIANLEAIPHEVKTAMDALFHNMAVKDDAVYSDEYAVFHAWATATNLLSISATFAQGTSVVYDTDSLDSLKQYLTVRANYDDGTSATVTSYTLSGTLSAGTSTITVTYEGMTTTFNVTVTGTVHIPDGSFTFSDGSTVTVSNNHVRAYFATYSTMRFVNLSAMSDNTTDVFSNSNVNNKSTSFLSLSAGDTLTLYAYNASTDNTVWGAAGTAYDIAVNMRKQNASTSILPAATLYPASITYPHSQQRITEAEVTATMEEATVASNVFLYMAQRYPAGTTFECDIRITKE